MARTKQLPVAVRRLAAAVAGVLVPHRSLGGQWTWLWALGPVLLAQTDSPPRPPMDPATRARALIVLAGVAILGVAAIILVWLGSRAVRHAMSRSESVRRRCGARPREDDWAGKPLISESQILEDDAGQ